MRENHDLFFSTVNSHVRNF